MRRIAWSWNTMPNSPPATPRTMPPSGKSWKSDEFTPEVQLSAALKLFNPDHWIRYGIDCKPDSTRKRPTTSMYPACGGEPSASPNVDDEVRSKTCNIVLAWVANTRLPVCANFHCADADNDG